MTARELVAAIQEGLPLVPRPFQALAARLGVTEAEVLTRLQEWVATGVIRRYGLVVRHHELGYVANAMTVWDVPDAAVADVAARMVATGAFSLCYRRPRRPDWPYNLFAMAHGRERGEVLARLRGVRETCGLEAIPYEVLFSTRRFKQRGARYA